MRNFNFKEIKKEKQGGKIIAMGETTHKHQIKDDNIELYKSLEDECLLLKVLKKPVEITHEEHKKIELMPTNYKRRFVREYDHIKEEARKVID